MNAIGKLKALFVMSRKQSKFVPADWFELARSRLPNICRRGTPYDEAPRHAPRSESDPTLKWRFGSDSQFSSKSSTKRIRETDGLPTSKSPKLCTDSSSTNSQERCHDMPGKSTISAGNPNCIPFRTYHSGHQDNSRCYNQMFSANFHHSSNQFDDMQRPSRPINEEQSKTRDHESCRNATSSSFIPPMHHFHVDENRFRFQLARWWERIDSPSNADTPSVPLRVVSYNILSQKLLELNGYLYHKCNPNILPWRYRWQKLQQEFKELSADILCLQEVEEYHFNSDISKFLDQNDYEYHYKRRTGNNKNKPDGVLIAYKKNRFQLLERRRVEYYRGSYSPVNQDNVAIITLLKPRCAAMSEDSCLCVVNTHLLYNPKRGDIKLAQLSTLFAEIHDRLSRYDMSKVPIMMCGDFNSTPRSHLYNFITTQELHYERVQWKDISGQRSGTKGKHRPIPEHLLPQSLCISQNGCVKVGNDHVWDEEHAFRFRHSLGRLQSAYCHELPQASTTQDRGVTVDYIFYTPDNDPNGFSICPRTRLSLINQESLVNVQGIPNAVHPSDHLPIVVDFDILLPQHGACEL